MIIKANGVGASYAIPNESFIAEMPLGVSGLRVIVDTGFRRVEDSLWIEYHHFDVPRGFRYLDEGDLLRYWGDSFFCTANTRLNVLSVELPLIRELCAA